VGRRFEPVWAHPLSRSHIRFLTYTFKVTTSNTWLITGGAGYIGSHIADEFLADGKDVIVYDSLYRGLESRVDYLRKKFSKEIPLIVADIRDTNAFTTALQEHQPHGIIHTAALKSVHESMQKPDVYFEVNLHATRGLLETITYFGIRNCIFSSTAAVYGTPNEITPVKESQPKIPVSPYGASKLAAEGLMADFFEREGNFGTCLRFFNVIGAASIELADNSKDNLVPITFDRLIKNEKPLIFGTDFPTFDGTCIRDYVDVRDVARAHLAAAKFEVRLPLAMNVGTGRGESVRSMINLICSILGKTHVDVVECDRRAGDPA
jgi:UDP-glucose 4-epimerase